MERWRWNVVFSTHSSQHSRVCVFSHSVQVITSVFPLQFYFYFRFDGEMENSIFQYQIADESRTVPGNTFYFFLRANKKVFRGEIVFFDHRWHKNSQKILWIFISPSPILKYYCFSREISRNLSIGLTSVFRFRNTHEYDRSWLNKTYTCWDF